MQEASQPHPEWSEGHPPSFTEAPSDLLFGWQPEKIREPGPNNEHGSTLPVVAETYTPIEAPQEEPLTNFDLTQFDDYTPDPSERPVVDAINHTIFKGAAEKYPDFVFSSGRRIDLDQRLSSGQYVKVRAIASGELHILATAEDPEDSTQYFYFKKDDAWHRGEPVAAMADDLPKDGEVPTKIHEFLVREHRELHRTAVEEISKEVGIAEMSHVARLVANAEPESVGMFQILRRVQSRQNTPLKPSDSDARAASPLFNETIQRFLQRNGYDSEIGPVTITGDAIHPDQSSISMQIRVGQNQDASGEAVPFMVLDIDEIHPDGFQWGQERTYYGGKAQEVVYYDVQDGKLQSRHDARTLDKDGKVIYVHPEVVTNAEPRDVEMIAHFLRRPRFRTES
jgi:hypothetical protein